MVFASVLPDHTIEEIVVLVTAGSPQDNLKVLFCRTCWINPHSTDKWEEGVLRGHLALRQRAAALCTPACWPLLHRPEESFRSFSAFPHMPRIEITGMTDARVSAAFLIREYIWKEEGI